MKEHIDENGLENIKSYMLFDKANMSNKKVQQNVITCNALLDRQLALGFPQKALDLLDEMTKKEEISSNLPRPDSFSYNIVVKNLCAKRETCMMAMQVKDRMLKEDFDKKDQTYTQNNLIKGTIQLKNLNGIWGLLEEMITEGIPKDKYT